MPSLSGRFVRLAAVLAVGLIAACQPQSRNPPATSQAPGPTTTTPQPGPTRQLVAGQPVKVALLLPLTGRFSDAGQALQNAAQMALFDAGDAQITLLTKDTGDTPEGAAAAMQAAINEGAQLVLGPLLGSQIDAVRPLAQTANVNVVSFSNDETKAGGNVFIMGLSPREQAKRIVAYAIGRGFGQVAIIAPNTPFGQASAQGAQNAAATSGGSVVATVFYDTSKLDLSDEVRQLGTGYNAVLAPDGAKRMIGLAPLLAYYEATSDRVKYLGSALWEDPLIGTEPNLVGGWFPAAAPAAWETFKVRYAGAHGGEPPRVAALGYDGVALAAFLARNGLSGQPSIAAATPGQWAGLDQTALTAPTGFAGVEGIFRFRPDGKVERGLAILEVQRDGFPIVEGPPSAFEAVTF